MHFMKCLILNRFRQLRNLKLRRIMNTFSMLFFIKRTKLLNNGEAPIFLRITTNSLRGNFFHNHLCQVLHLLYRFNLQRKISFASKYCLVLMVGRILLRERVRRELSAFSFSLAKQNLKINKKNRRMLGKI